VIMFKILCLKLRVCHNKLLNHTTRQDVEFCVWRFLESFLVPRKCGICAPFSSLRSEEHKYRGQTFVIIEISFFYRAFCSDVRLVCSLYDSP
jgi:hypothetical protein